MRFRLSPSFFRSISLKTTPKSCIPLSSAGTSVRHCSRQSIAESAKQFHKSTSFIDSDTEIHDRLLSNPSLQMPLLTLITDRDAKVEIKDRFFDNPHCCLIYQAMLFDLQKAFPYSQMFLYSAVFGTNTYWYMYIKNRFVKPHIIFHNEGVFDEEEFLSGFKELATTHDILTGKLFMCIGNQKYTDVVSKWMETAVTKTPVPIRFKPYPCHFFYMMKEQRDTVANMKRPEVPERYELGESNPDTDSDIITKTWKHSGEGDLEQTRAKLQQFPSSCVRFNGSPVAFEMYDHLGHLNHQYCFEEHRGKGLGNAVELDLCQKILSRGYLLFKSVETNNVSVYESSMRSKLWTRVKNEDGSDLIIIYLDVTYL